ncbi:Equilibrative nucleotide transporter 8 [Acorus gramineus]|uniref:Equilibrative nucleotide transporter 8 n=1 Tax=Acorus gramineus TaxID=55184 RepID=A0AAV8ZWS3_ACOGR|nr:Equilibrative nucleotide transporter 8 [Acorus gramineus]
MLGVANLLPWNAFITAVDYFGHLYPDQHVDRVFSVAYLGSSLLVLIGLVSTRNWSQRPSLQSRMNVGLSLFVCSLMTVLVLDWTCIRRKYGATVAAVTVCGLADGLVGGSLIGSVGELPERYMQAVFTGTACSGVIVCILRIITKASLPHTSNGLQKSAHFYFIVSVFISLGCIICYNILESLLVVQYFRKKKTQTLQNIPARTPWSTAETKMNLRFWNVLKRIRWSALGVFMIYVITLSMFPGYITENVQSGILGDWYPIILILAYNASDMAGKSLTAIHVPDEPKRAVWCCMARLLFYPLFGASLHGPKVFRTEIPVIVLTCSLGVTNGYLTSVLMILAPKSVPPREAETAGMIMALSLAIGLVGGSVLGWFWII